jgi:hypothetical protein
MASGDSLMAGGNLRIPERYLNRASKTRVEPQQIAFV